MFPSNPGRVSGLFLYRKSCGGISPPFSTSTPHMDPLHTFRDVPVTMHAALYELWHARQMPAHHLQRMQHFLANIWSTLIKSIMTIRLIGRPNESHHQLAEAQLENEVGFLALLRPSCSPNLHLTQGYCSDGPSYWPFAIFHWVIRNHGETITETVPKQGSPLSSHHYELSPTSTLCACLRGARFARKP